MAVETYEDGSYCVFNPDGSGGCWNADGYQTDAWDAPTSADQTHTGPGIFDAITNWIGGFTGNYPNQYQQNQFHQATNYQGTPLNRLPQPQGHCSGLQIGGSVGAGGQTGGGGVCLPWWGLALGGALVLSYFGGKTRGRGR